MSTKGITTIAVSRETHSTLMRVGSKGETFDDVLAKVLQNTRIGEVCNLPIIQSEEQATDAGGNSMRRPRIPSPQEQMNEAEFQFQLFC